MENITNNILPSAVFRSRGRGTGQDAAQVREGSVGKCDKRADFWSLEIVLLVISAPRWLPACRWWCLQVRVQSIQFHLAVTTVSPTSRAVVTTWMRARASDVHVSFGARNRVKVKGKNHGLTRQKWTNLTAKTVGQNKKSGVVHAEVLTVPVNAEVQPGVNTKEKRQHQHLRGSLA